MAYDAADVMGNDNLATSLSAQIQVIIVLIGMVKNHQLMRDISPSHRKT